MPRNYTRSERWKDIQEAIEWLEIDPRVVESATHTLRKKITPATCFDLPTRFVAEFRDALHDGIISYLDDGDMTITVSRLRLICKEWKSGISGRKMR